MRLGDPNRGQPPEHAVHALAPRVGGSKNAHCDPDTAGGPCEMFLIRGIFVLRIQEAA
jgi:hypothetical protein